MYANSGFTLWVRSLAVYSLFAYFTFGQTVVLPIIDIDGCSRLVAVIQNMSLISKVACGAELIWVVQLSGTVLLTVVQYCRIQYHLTSCDGLICVVLAQARNR